MKVAVDAGNGCGGTVAAPLMKQLGLDVTELFIEMDGRFPNHHPDPTVEANMRSLQRAVKEKGAQIGIAYDGDADRLGAVDENGRVVWGDELRVVFSRAIVKVHRGANIICDAKCSQRMYVRHREHGGRPIMWKAGHSLIKRASSKRACRWPGDERTMFFADRYFGFDDAIYASFRCSRS